MILKKNFSLSKIAGFTLVEVMLVVSVVAILGGVSVSIINRGRQQDRAKDATNLTNLTKLASGMEAYYYSEGRYPAKSGDGNGNPLSLSSSAVNVSLGEYVRIWPTEATFYYITDLPAPSIPTKFAIYVKKNVDDKYYKYRSTTSEIAECTSTDIATVDTCNTE